MTKPFELGGQIGGETYRPHQQAKVQKFGKNEFKMLISL